MPKHIRRLLILMVVFGVALWTAKWYFTQDSFYRFGHYRANSVIEIANLTPQYRTPRYCEPCHAERTAQWSAGNHKTVSCEVCHGPGEGHPEKVAKLPIPRDTPRLCALCHEAMAGRPKAQPQIDVALHSGGQACVACHNAHAPKITAVAIRFSADAGAGRQLASACASCHGAEGMSASDTWPNLAGQHPAYLARMLGAFKSGAQKDVMMTPLASGLSDTDVQNLAAYFGSLACKPERRETHVGDAAAGGALAKNCAACHGATGIATNAAWPSLAGQKAGYLMNTLKAFRAGERKDPTMAGVARVLSDTDIANVAEYFASQGCQPATQARRGP